MPRLYLAAYTTPPNEKTGYRWIWNAQRLPEALLGTLYSKIRKPTDVARWAPGEIHGGMVSVDAEWCAVYRFLNAGRDALGRQGRFFLAVGFLRSNELPQLDLQAALESAVFSTPLNAAPQRTELDLPSVSVRCPDDLLEKLRVHSLVETTGSERINQLTAASAQVGRATGFNLELNGELPSIACKLSLSSPAVIENERGATPPISTVQQNTTPAGFPRSEYSPFGRLANRRFLSILAVGVIVLFLYARLGSRGSKRPENSGTRVPQEMPSEGSATAQNEGTNTTTLKSSGSTPDQALADAMDRWEGRYGTAKISLITITPDSSSHWICQVAGANVQKQLPTPTPAKDVRDQIIDLFRSNPPRGTPAASTPP